MKRVYFLECGNILFTRDGAYEVIGKSNRNGCLVDVQELLFDDEKPNVFKRKGEILNWTENDVREALRQDFGISYRRVYVK